MTSYPTITVWQPWASLAAYGFKPLEFRGWAAPKRLWHARIAIHAGARAVRRQEVAGLILKLRDMYAAASTGLVRIPEAVAFLERVHTSPGILPLSSVLCLATLGEPVRDEALAALLGVKHINDSDRDEHSNWGWPLSDVEVLQPYVPAGGHQGWWYWERPQ